MSLDIRLLTNGEKSVYTVRNSGVTPMTLEVYESIDEIDKSIRHYALKRNKQFCEPDLARAFGVLDIFYPDHAQTCARADSKTKNCIAESCRYSTLSGAPEQGQCPYVGTSFEYIPSDEALHNRKEIDAKIRAFEKKVNGES